MTEQRHAIPELPDNGVEIAKQRTEEALEREQEKYGAMDWDSAAKSPAEHLADESRSAAEWRARAKAAEAALNAFEGYWTGKTCGTVEQGDESWSEFLRLKDNALAQIRAAVKE